MYDVIMFVVRVVRRILSAITFILFIFLALLAGAVYGLNGGLEWPIIIFVLSQLFGITSCALWPHKKSVGSG